MMLTEVLLGEHGVFYALCAYLEQAVHAATSLAQVQAQTALLHAALETHARLEDELLFTALEPDLGPIGTLAVMRLEHDEIEHNLAQLAQATDLAQAQEFVQRIIQVAREHFATEEQVFFPLAEQTLGAERLRSFSKLWAEQRGNRMHAAYTDAPPVEALVAVQTTLDVRSLPPAQRQARILARFTHLRPGEAFLLVNDHDPKPLYEFVHKRQGQFTWEYVEQGLEVWRVRIGRCAAATET
jgi:uncharacterized protein (DUF2249 family)/hemerythrin-like domain-containing protein